MARVLIRGCGDVGSAVAHLLLRGGHEVVIHDVALPAAPRRGMAFADAIFDGACELDGVRARRAELARAGRGGARAEVLVSVAPELGDVLAALLPDVLVDARMRKRAQPEPQRGLAPLTIGLGPNFVAGETVDVAIETQWGDELGAVVHAGRRRSRSAASRAPSRATPATASSTPRSAASCAREAAIAQRVAAGETVATIGDEALRAPLDGILRGLVHDGVPVAAGAKVLEVDPRGDLTKVFGIGPRPRRIAEGVLEAMQAGAGGV